MFQTEPGVYGRRGCRTVLGASLLLLLLIPSGVRAQTTTPDPRAAQPERPSVANNAATVAAGFAEIEAGTELDRAEDHSWSAVVPVVLKLGLASALQLSLQVPIVRPAGESTGAGDFTVGLKWRVKERGGIIGDFAVLPSVKTPTGSATSGRGTGTTDVGLLLISSHELGSVAMDLNVGFTGRTGDGTTAPRRETVWTASFGGPLVRRLGFVAELYGYPPTSGPSARNAIVAVLTGPTIQLGKRLTVDAGVIAPIAGPQPRAFYVGVVRNIGRMW